MQFHHVQTPKGWLLDEENGSFGNGLWDTI